MQGQQFGMAEITTFIACFFQQFEVEPLDSKAPPHIAHRIVGIQAPAKTFAVNCTKRTEKLL
jgi:hypothetical protein